MCATHVSPQPRVWYSLVTATPPRVLCGSSVLRAWRVWSGLSPALPSLVPEQAQGSGAGKGEQLSQSRVWSENTPVRGGLSLGKPRLFPSIVITTLNLSPSLHSQLTLFIFKYSSDENFFTLPLSSLPAHLRLGSPSVATTLLGQWSPSCLSCSRT